MERIYISGPMTGYPDHNYPAFHDAAHQLLAAGYQPINPARLRHGLNPDVATWDDYMRAALVDLSRADAVATLPGADQSRGAEIETMIATRLGWPVEPLTYWLARPQAGAA